MTSPLTTGQWRSRRSTPCPIYTDWTIGHVHAGALGWVAMITFGSLYHMIAKLYGRAQMHSIALINLHFWLATIGTVFYKLEACS